MRKQDKAEKKEEKSDEDYKKQFENIPKMFVWVRNDIETAFLETDRKYYGGGQKAFWCTATSKVGCLKQRKRYLDPIVYYEAQLKALDDDRKRCLSEMTGEMDKDYVCM